MHDQYISDWDNAYANSMHIVGGDKWGDIWQLRSAAFREQALKKNSACIDIAYADNPRNRYDLFLPETAARGLVVFIHGGFWTETDKSYWSYLAQGSTELGYAVAMPSYSLCPDIRISGIANEVAQFMHHVAAKIDGPIYLAGHSAGGQLASRMVTDSSPLDQDILWRIKHVMSISGLHDLRPLMRMQLNTQLRIDETEANIESPALLYPNKNTRLTCYAGSQERPEFIRQSKILAGMWLGLGATTTTIIEPDKHHFNIVDGLSQANHAITRRLLLSHSAS